MLPEVILDNGSKESYSLEGTVSCLVEGNHMPSIIEAITQTENFMPEIQIRQNIVLFKFGTKERANPTAKAKSQGKTEGNSYLKGTFVGEDERGLLTCQKVLNVYFSNKSDLTFFTGNGLDVKGVGSTCLVFLMGQLGWNDISVDGKLNKNQSYSLSSSALCTYDSNGEFYYSEESKDGTLTGVTLKGEPGAVVCVRIDKAGVMELAPKLDRAKRPGRKAIEVSTKIDMKPLSESTSSPEGEDFEIPAQSKHGAKAVDPKAKVPA